MRISGIQNYNLRTRQPSFQRLLIDDSPGFFVKGLPPATLYNYMQIAEKELGDTRFYHLYIIQNCPKIVYQPNMYEKPKILEDFKLKFVDQGRLNHIPEEKGYRLNFSAYNGEISEELYLNRAEYDQLAKACEHAHKILTHPYGKKDRTVLICSQKAKNPFDSDYVFPFYTQLVKKLDENKCKKISDNAQYNTYIFPESFKISDYSKETLSKYIAFNS